MFPSHWGVMSLYLRFLFAIMHLHRAVMLFFPTTTRWGFTHYRIIRPRFTFYSQPGTPEGFSKLLIRPRHYGRQFASASASAEDTSVLHKAKVHTHLRSKSKWVWMGSFVGLVGTLFIWDHYYNARTLSRNARTVWNGMMLVLDYKFVPKHSRDFS
jgi:hypothetical protein